MHTDHYFCVYRGALAALTREEIMIGWLTNDQEAARRLKAADREFDRAKAATGGMTLAQKVEALRIAKAARQDAYEAVQS